MNAVAIRACGAAVAVGGVTWGITMIVSPPQNGVNNTAEIAAGGVFQLGLVAVLAVMLATDAVGRSRWRRGVLIVELAAVGLAIGWTIPYIFEPNRPATGILPVLDAFWPLSMAGFIVVGVLTLRARIWPAPARYLPLAASLLIPVDVVAIVAAGDAGALIVRALYLGAAYTLLGLAIVRDVAALSNATPQDRVEAALAAR